MEGGIYKRFFGRFVTGYYGCFHSLLSRIIVMIAKAAWVQRMAQLEESEADKRKVPAWKTTPNRWVEWYFCQKHDIISAQGWIPAQGDPPPRVGGSGFSDLRSITGNFRDLSRMSHHQGIPCRADWTQIWIWSIPTGLAIIWYKSSWFWDIFKPLGNGLSNRFWCPCYIGYP